MIKLIIAVVLVSLLLGGQASTKEWEKVRIGVEGAFPPFSFVDQEGNLQGFDIDIARALCEAMQVECTLVQSDWDGIIPGLLARKYDAIIASMSITEERKKKVGFTGKYYHTPAKFVAKKGADIELSEESLQGKTVGVLRASIFDNYITDNFKDTVEIKRYGSQDEAYLDLVSGRLDLVLGDSVAIKEGFLSTEQGADFAFVGPDLYDPRWFGVGAGIAVRKSDDELRKMFNEAIKEIRANGAYQKIQDKYFDFDVYGS